MERRVVFCWGQKEEGKKSVFIKFLLSLTRSPITALRDPIDLFLFPFSATSKQKRASKSPAEEDGEKKTENNYRFELF
jgi:hypothetical protein